MEGLEVLNYRIQDSVSPYLHFLLLEVLDFWIEEYILSPSTFALYVCCKSLSLFP